MEDNLQLAKKYFHFETNKNIKYIELIPDGIWDDTFLINNAYIIKLDRNFKDPFYDKTDNLLMLTMLGDFKFSEKMLSFDTNKPYTIFKSIHQAVPYIDKMDSLQLISISKVLKKLHAVNAPDYLPEFEPFERLEFYKSKTKVKDRIDGRYEKKLCRMVKDIYDKFPRCICHNNLSQNNMLFSFTDAFLINLESSTLNVAEYDLASLVCENNLNEEFKNLVLKTYYGAKLTQLKTKRINILCGFINVLWFYWAHFMYKETSNEVYLNIANIKKAKIEIDRKTI